MEIESTDEWRDETAPPIVWEPIRPARSHANYWVKDTDRRFSRGFGRLLSHCGIIASEWIALRELYRPMRHSFLELVGKSGMSKGGASKLVSRLERKGLVVKYQEGFDRRFRGIELTREGRDIVVQTAAIERDIDREFFGPLGNTRRFRMTESMQRFLLSEGHIQRIARWVRLQLKERTLIRVSRDARAKAAAEAQARSNELYNAYKRLGERLALGDPAAFAELHALILS
jgi:DNA-binding MarR family transcriptional regulator